MSQRPESSRKSETSKSFAPPRASSKMPAPANNYEDSDEEEDDVPELPKAKTRMPTTFAPRGSVAPQGTTLNRDKPAGTTLNRDKIPGTTLNRDKAKSMAPGTMLNRDKSRSTVPDPLGPSTTLKRDLSTIPKAKTIMLTAVASKRPASTAPARAKSILIRPQDITMAAKQLNIESMGPAERKLQDEWAKQQMAKTPTCPDAKDWERRHGGYQCKGKHHGITDALLAEGKGGLLSLESGVWEDVEAWVGPYYPIPNRPGYYEKVEVLE